MKRIVLLLAALGAAVYVLFFDVAVLSSGGWKSFMGVTSLVLGLLALAVTPCFRERPHAQAAVFTAAMFFLLIHPVFLMLGAISWLCMIAIASVLIAGFLKRVNERDGYDALRNVASSSLALMAASGGLLYVYDPFEDSSFLYIVIIQVFLFLLALVAAPWGRVALPREGRPFNRLAP